MEKIDLDEELYELWKVRSLLEIYQDFVKNHYPTEKDFEHGNYDSKKRFAIYAIESEKYNPIIDSTICLIDCLYKKLIDKVDSQYRVSDKELKRILNT